MLQMNVRINAENALVSQEQKNSLQINLLSCWTVAHQAHAWEGREVSVKVENERQKKNCFSMLM